MLGLGMLLAASIVSSPVYAEDLVDPKKTGGEVVKAPSSAPTSKAKAPASKPVANPEDGGALVSHFTLHWGDLFQYEKIIKT